MAGTDDDVVVVKVNLPPTGADASGFNHLLLSEPITAIKEEPVDVMSESAVNLGASGSSIFSHSVSPMTSSASALLHGPLITPQSAYSVVQLGGAGYRQPVPGLQQSVPPMLPGQIRAPPIVMPRAQMIQSGMMLPNVIPRSVHHPSSSPSSSNSINVHVTSTTGGRLVGNASVAGGVLAPLQAGPGRAPLPPPPLPPPPPVSMTSSSFVSPPITSGYLPRPVTLSDPLSGTNGGRMFPGPAAGGGPVNGRRAYVNRPLAPQPIGPPPPLPPPPLPATAPTCSTLQHQVQQMQACPSVRPPISTTLSAAPPSGLGVASGQPTVVGSGSVWGSCVRGQDGSLAFLGVPTGITAPKLALEIVGAGAQAGAQRQADPLRIPISSEEVNTPNKGFNVLELLKDTPAEIAGRKGFYTCLYCRATFSHSALFASHLSRPVARVEYRCQVCEQTLTRPNRCAIFAHIAINHPDVLNKPGSGTTGRQRILIDSRLTVLPLAGSIDEYKTALGQWTADPVVRHFKWVVADLLGQWDFDLTTPYLHRTGTTSCWRRLRLIETAQQPVTAFHRFLSPGSPALFLTGKGQHQQPSLLRCLMCDFTTTQPEQLVQHLEGSWPNSATKCALCSLSVPVNREKLCAVKAHLFLHLDCYIMCPRCGFTPPPFLSPLDTEIVMRLHIRFVCYHFNVVQIFLCQLCAAAGKAYNNLQQLHHHVFEEHVQRRYQCSYCPTGLDGSGISTTTMLNSPVEIANHVRERHPGRINQSLPADSAKHYNLVYKCPECSVGMKTKEVFVNHYGMKHGKNLTKGKSAYRCFGNCKRIHLEVSEFAAHQGTCEHCIQLRGQLQQTQWGAGQEYAGLFFCLHCGIGARKRKPGNPAGDDQQSGGSSLYEATYFPGPNEMHDHDACHLTYDGSTQSACPWCTATVRMMPQDLPAVLQHLRTHISDNSYAAYHIERAKSAKDNAAAVMECRCGATLDSPAALYAHSEGPHLVSNSEMPCNLPSCHAPLPLPLYMALRLRPVPKLRRLGFPAKHSSLVECPECKYVTETEWSMTLHVFSEHRSLICYICRHYRANEDVVQPHLWRHMFDCMQRASLALATSVRNIAQNSPQRTTAATGDESRMEEVGDEDGENEEEEQSEDDNDDEEFDDEDYDLHFGSRSGKLASLRRVRDEDGPDPQPPGEEVSSHAVPFEDTPSVLVHPGTEAAPSARSRTPLSSSGRGTVLMYETADLECEVCGEMVFTRDELAEHLRVTHQLQLPDEAEDAERLCVSCGVKVRCGDPWEEHCIARHSRLLRRAGIVATEPNSILLESSSPATYQCYVCHCRFSKKLTCEKHMTATHKLTKAEINWGLLTETPESKKRTKIDRHSGSGLGVDAGRDVAAAPPEKRLRLSSTEVIQGMPVSSAPFICACCPCTCPSRATLAVHVRQRHPQMSSPGWASCPECGLAFASDRTLRLHLRTAHGVAKPDKFLAELVITADHGQNLDRANGMSPAAPAAVAAGESGAA